MFANGAITKVVVDNIQNYSSPDLDGATFDMYVYVADTAQPIWPGTPMPVINDGAFMEDAFTATNGERYAIVHP